MTAVLFAASPAAAQLKPDPQLSSEQIALLEARRDMLFQRMLAEPSDLDIAFEYAAISAQLGDVEGAISTLERMLIFAPGLPRVQLELGVLYTRLGAVDVARTYFEAALMAPDVPPEVADRVAVYLATIDRSEQRTKYNATLAAGIRWQSNANAAPEIQDIILNGVPFLLSPTSLGTSDANAFLSGNLHATFDLKNQGDLFEVSVTGYGAGYFELEQLDTLIGEIAFGPSFNMARYGWDNTRIGVYGILLGASLDHVAYLGSLGGGVRLTTRLNEWTAFNALAEYRDRQYHDSATYPTASLRDGGLFRFVAGVGIQLTSNAVLRVAGHVEHQDAAADFYTNTEFGGALGVTVEVPSIIPKALPWIVNLDGGAIRRNFDAPDPTINVFASERDDEFWARAGLLTPIYPDLGILFQTEYRTVDSNYPTRDYDNFLVSVAIVKNFSGGM